jgi:hypothetical protein
MLRYTSKQACACATYGAFVRDAIISILAGLATIAVAVLALHYSLPAVPESLYNILLNYPSATMLWLVLTVIGVDYAITATRDAIGYHQVGAKSRAQLHKWGQQ